MLIVALDFFFFFYLRGGLRLVTPGTGEQYAMESGRHYDECYGLAFAQSLKNKDIAEGNLIFVYMQSSFN